MDARSLRPAIGIVAVLLVQLSSFGPVEANCALNREFNSQFQYVYWPVGAAGEGSFWALGDGDPAIGSGIDGGLYPVTYWGYLYVQGAWASPDVDGCIDEAGDSPTLDGDECMVIHLEQQWLGKGHSGVASARAEPDGTPVFDFAQPEFYITLPPILRPTLVSAQPAGGQASLTFRLAEALPTQHQLVPGCSDGVIEGYRLYSRTVPAGEDPPQEMAVSDGWLEETITLPIAEHAELTVTCGDAEDTFVSTRLFFDSGFSSSFVSEPARRINTATDSDDDGTADACDPCTDGDGDGFGNPGRPSNLCAVDNCVALANPDQLDQDLDGVGDACDVCPGRADPRARLLVDLGQSTDQLLGAMGFGGNQQSALYLARKGSSSWELFHAATAGGPALRLNPPLVQRGDVKIFDVAPNGTTVVYEADQDRDEVNELYGVSMVNFAVSKLNGPLVEGGEVRRSFLDRPRFTITPDSRRVIYLADQDTDDVTEIYSVPVNGIGSPVKLNGPLVAGGDVGLFLVSSDSSTVIYEADQDTDGKQELYRVPVAGGAAVRLSGTHSTSVRRFALSPDGSRLVYDILENGQGTIYSVPVGGGPAIPLNPPAIGSILRLAINPGSTHVVYHAAQTNPGDFELFSVPLAGGPVVRLNPPMGAGGDVDKFGFTPDGDFVVFLSRQQLGLRTELYAAPVAGGNAKKLNGPILAGGNIHEFAVSPDSSTVVYQGDQDAHLVFEIYSVPILGGVPAKLNGPLVEGGDVRIDFSPDGAGFEITPDGSNVLYLADQRVDGFDELFVVPITGGSPTRVSDPATMNRVTGFRIDPAGERVLFSATPGIHESPIVPGDDADLDGFVQACDACTDLDGDGFGNDGYPGTLCALDNCAVIDNPDQIDNDLDGAGDACDCAPLDPTVRQPADVAGLMLDRVGPSTARLSWPPATGADGYSITRGSLADLSPSQYGGCLGQVTGESIDDVGPPLPGSGHFYLVQGVSDSCGVGSLGFTSGTGERDNDDPAACH